MQDVHPLWQAPAIVVELETALDCEPRRIARTFAALRSQLQQLRPRLLGEPELIVVFDPASWDGPTLQSVLGCCEQEHEWPGNLRLAAAPHGTGYYEHKNLGFSLTTSPLLVFFDGDLLPDDGWLEEMLRPFADFRVAAVVGNTYMNTTSLYARCVALFWIFETRASRPVLRRATRLVSNSVAFRRALFFRCPFPHRDTYRGQCSELAGILSSRGVMLCLSSAAQSRHPPPKGARGFMRRAMHAGHDECVYQGLNGPAGSWGALAVFRRDLRAVRTRISCRATQLQAGYAVIAAAAALGLAFYSLKLAGYLLTTVRPRAVQRLWGGVGGRRS
jgi:hypothetical protein